MRSTRGFEDFSMRDYHTTSSPLRRLFDVICPFFQAFCALPYTVAMISKYCIAICRALCGSPPVLNRAASEHGLHGVIVTSVRNLARASDMRAERLDL